MPFKAKLVKIAWKPPSFASGNGGGVWLYALVVGDGINLKPFLVCPLIRIRFPASIATSFYTTDNFKLSFKNTK